MKLQDVLLKAMAKKISWWDAAEIIGGTDRTMRRWRERMEAEGYSGLVDRPKVNPATSVCRWPGGGSAAVVWGGKFRFEHAKSTVELIYTWVQKALQGGAWGGAGSTGGGESGAP